MLKACMVHEDVFSSQILCISTTVSSGFRAQFSGNNVTNSIHSKMLKACMVHEDVFSSQTLSISTTVSSGF